MSRPDFAHMSKDEILAWFDTADDISPMVASVEPATEPVTRPAADAPMMLASIRLPVSMIERIDSLADLDGVRRSDIIRDALAAYVRGRTSSVGRDEAEHALDVLRGLVADRGESRVEAA